MAGTIISTGTGGSYILRTQFCEKPRLELIFGVYLIMEPPCRGFTLCLEETLAHPLLIKLQWTQTAPFEYYAPLRKTNTWNSCCFEIKTSTIICFVFFVLIMLLVSSLLWLFLCFLVFFVFVIISSRKIFKLKRGAILEWNSNIDNNHVKCRYFNFGGAWGSFGHGASNFVKM